MDGPLCEDCGDASAAIYRTCYEEACGVTLFGLPLVLVVCRVYLRLWVVSINETISTMHLFPKDKRYDATISRGSNWHLRTVSRWSSSNTSLLRYYTGVGFNDFNQE